MPLRGVKVNRRLAFRKRKAARIPYGLLAGVCFYSTDMLRTSFLRVVEPSLRECISHFLSEG